MVGSEMSTNTHPTIASCSQEENHISALAFAWIFHQSTRGWGERFAELLDQRLRQIMPKGRLSGILNGLEDEVRQNAALLLLEQYFHGNHRLHEARQNLDLVAAANQIQRSINAALRLSQIRLRRTLYSESQRFIQFEEIHHAPTHSPDCRHMFQLPFEDRLRLLVSLLEKSVTDRSLSKPSAEMIREMIDRGITQVQMARELGISRAALSQRISKISDVVQNALETTELPNS